MNNRESFDISFQEFQAAMRKLRAAFSRYAAAAYSLRTLTILTVSLIVLLVLEAIFYLSGSVRQSAVFGFSVLICFFILSNLFFFFAIRFNYISRYSDENLCRMIGKKFPNLRDRLLNAFQLIATEKYLTDESRSLAQLAFNNIWQRANREKLENIVPFYKLKKEFLRTFVVLSLLIPISAIFPDSMVGAAHRLLHPHTRFERPLPFSLNCISGDFTLTGGEKARLTFTIDGENPPNLFLRLKDKTEEKLLPVEYGGEDTLSYTVQEVYNDFSYSLVSINTGLIRLWKEISSPVHRIQVKDRPEIVNVSIAIDYPDYAGLPDETRELSGIEIRALKGSLIHLKALTSQPVQAGWLMFSDSTQTVMSVDDDLCSATFQVMSKTDFRIYIENKNGIRNRDPIQYSVVPEYDGYPSVTLLSPLKEFDLDQSMSIPLHFRMRDDFGFTKAAILYTKRSGLNAEETNVGSRLISGLRKSATAQELFYTWDVSELGLFPRDELEFKIQVYDNDEISGPKMAESQTVTARFPSLTDLFARTEELQDSKMEEVNDAVEEMRNVKEIIDETVLEMKKNPQLDWEQKKEMESAVEKTLEAVEKMEKISQDIQQLIDQADKNNLFSPEVMEKYQQLQEAFQEVLTPELKEALEKLQKALESLNQEDIQRALQDFQITQEQFLDEIERMLDLFKRVQIEQRTDALVKYLEDMVSREDEILNKMEGEENLSSLADKQEQLSKDVENLQEMMSETASMMEEFPIMPADSLRKILKKMQEMQVPDNLMQSANQMQQGNTQQAWDLANLSQEDLQKMLEEMMAFQQYFQQQSVGEMTRRFRNVLNKTLQLSQRQEALAGKTASTSNQSPRVRDIAREQNRMRTSLSALLEDLIALSKETFAVTRDIGMALGRASANMGKAQSHLENRNLSGARNAQKAATAALNQTALSIMQAMEAMQQSGSASGFQNYLQQMQQLSQQQQGINQQSLQLGLGSPMDMAGKEALRRLAAKQRQIQESLENLQNELAGNQQQSRQLKGITKEMEEVARDLENNSILRRTIERQQRILSRMLSAQKSLRQKDFEEKRKSKTAGKYEIVPPPGMPRNRGEKHLVLEKNLLKALNDGYTKDYETLIQRYFESLQSESARGNNQNE